MWLFTNVAFPTLKLFCLWAFKRLHQEINNLFKGKNYSRAFTDSCFHNYWI